MEEEKGSYGRYTAQPLERGWGTTVGNALRRVLLSSIEGAAITAVKIEGVEHEFTAVPGVVEDVTDVILNLKQLAIRLHEDGPRTLLLDAKTKGLVTADAFDDDAQIEILSGDAPIATLADGGRLRLEATIGKGRGYVPADRNFDAEAPIGTIPLDSAHSPVRRVNYHVEAARGRPGDRLRQARDRGLDERILQAEFALTQVLDRPVTGRAFFEEVIRENLDIGRPSQAQLIFERRVNRRTPGRFRTRVITEGVIPSLHVDYKSSRIKQYHKEGRALRTETTINNTRDFGIGKHLRNLPALGTIGFQANRRLLDVQTVSHDCAIGEHAFDQVVRPIEVDGQRAAALRFGGPRTQGLLNATGAL